MDRVTWYRLSFVFFTTILEEPRGRFCLKGGGRVLTRHNPYLVVGSVSLLITDTILSFGLPAAAAAARVGVELDRGVIRGAEPPLV